MGAGDATSDMMKAWAYFKGEYMPLEEATVTIAAHALNYGTGVFEGIRAYWNPEQDELYGVFVKEHYQRMAINSRLVKMALPLGVDQICDITRELLRRNGYRQNVYVRPLLFKATPALGIRLSHVTEEFGIFCVPMDDYLDVSKGLHACVSSWFRVDDNALPGRGKITGSYVNAALAADDARASGFDESIMLSADGHVSEGSSCNLFVVREGRLITSPVTDAILEGITRRAMLEVARDLGIPFEVRAIDRTELYIADELFFCGTGVQVTPITRVDHRPIGTGQPGEIAMKMQEIYFNAVRGKEPRYRHWLMPVYGKA